MEKMSRKITIFEGPDGSGKSTLSEKFAVETGALYIHFDAMRNVIDTLGRVYSEAMLPALLGYRDLVFDRSWLSEMPYNTAFHKGKERLSNIDFMTLERLAMRCGAVVVKCQPSWETVKSNYLSRREIEMLNNEDQLKLVYDLYDSQDTTLPVLKYDYTKNISSIPELINDIDRLRYRLHPVNLKSVGNLSARKVIISNNINAITDKSTFFQWPFISFEDDSNKILAEQIMSLNISPNDCLWLDIDQDLSILNELKTEEIFVFDNSKRDIINRLQKNIEVNKFKIYELMRLI